MLSFSFFSFLYHYHYRGITGTLAHSPKTPAKVNNYSELKTNGVLIYLKRQQLLINYR